MAEQIDQKEANKALYISGAVILLVIVALFTNGFGIFSGGNNGLNGSVVDDFVKLDIGNSPVLGSKDAKVTIYEFSDLSCPYCAAADGKNEEVISILKARDPNWEAPIPTIIRDYVESGKVKIVFKYYPGHGTGKESHRVGWCLNDQNLFWKFHDKAFEQQEKTGNRDAMKSIAKELGADMVKLDECLNSAKYENFFNEDANMGASNGVKGTPAFFINGNLISGAESYSKFKKIIDREIS